MSDSIIVSNEEFDLRIARLTERQQALSESVGLVQGSVSDLGAIVRNMVADTRLPAGSGDSRGEVPD